MGLTLIVSTAYQLLASIKELETLLKILTQEAEVGR
jgi:hypothetical protein